MLTDPKRVQEIVAQALIFPAEADRNAYLDRECGNDPILRLQVDRLLISQLQPSIDLPSPASTLDRPLSMATGEHIPGAVTPVVVSSTKKQLPSDRVIAGRYTLLEIIGEGGMGAVYLAEQTEPVKRQVALKLIKSGMDSKGVLARFDAERQALAMMDHPNIARIYDGGVTPSGQPFFVMELVKGKSLTDYCDQQRLSVQSRLELFVQVCQAVQHAHQKGIIHRDLKPGNVLVTEVDGRPTPKVIDFGVAKATEQNLTDISYVDTGLIVGTPTYMSPEQADPASMDIDTRTDVYALGVILYELLSGSPPIDAKQFKRGAILEMLRMVREVEPPRPSTKLSSSDALPSIAANRDIEPAKLANLLRGELDWVVMKAIEKERSRRYETANGLARDIQRYLSDEVVEARPPSQRYRLRKFVRRNRVAVSAGLSVAAALLIGIVGFAWQAKLAIMAKKETQKRADELQQVADYQSKMLQQIDPTDAGLKLFADLRARHSAALEKSKVPQEEQSTRTTAFMRELQLVNATDAAVALLDRTVLAPAVRTIETEFANQPLVDATLRTTLGVVYDRLGRPEDALALYRRAYDLRKASLGDGNRDTLMSLGGVGRMLGVLRRHTEADTVLRATLEGFTKLLGEDHKETLDAKVLLATNVFNEGKYEDAENIALDILERRRRVQGSDHADTLATMSNLGQYMISRGNYAEAEKVLRKVLESQRRLGDAPMTGTLNNIGIVLTRQLEYVAAEPYLREALERLRQEKGEEHPKTLEVISSLATTLMGAAKFSEAEPWASELLEKGRRVYGPEHVDTLKAMNIMGQVLMRQKKYAETESYWREALETGRRVLGEEHPDTIIFIGNMGGLMDKLGRLAEAEAFYLEAFEKHRRQLGESHPYTLINIKNLADLYRRQNKPAAAEVYLRKSLEHIRREKGDEHLDTLSLIGFLGSTLRDQGKLDEAEPYFQKTMDATRRLRGEEHRDTLLAILRMANLRSVQSKHAEVIKLLTPIDGKVAKAFPGVIGVLRNASMIGLLGKARAGLAKQPAEFVTAENNLLEAQATFAKNLGDMDKETREWTQAVVDFYSLWDKAEPGKGHDAQASSWKAKMVPMKGTPPVK
jgi:eukaryotic-like serine/threonine-protein kinase